MSQPYRTTIILNRVRTLYYEAIDGCGIGFKSDREKYRKMLDDCITEALVEEIAWLDDQAFTKQEAR